MMRTLSFFICAAMVACVGALSPAAGAPAAMPPGESFNYDIRFLMFVRAAQGRLSIRPLGGRRYRAELAAETRGLVGILMYGRKNQYISEMEYDPEKRRFISRLYTKLVHKSAGTERTEAVIDTKTGSVRWKYFWRDKLVGQGSDPMPEGARVEDLLSAFFNFRLGGLKGAAGAGGGLGPLEPGRKITLFTLPDYKAIATNETHGGDEEKFQRFEIRIPSAKTERAYRKKFGRTKEKGLLALVKVPKNIFGQETGEVRVWLDPKMTPVATTVEDAIFFGDVEGILVKPPAGR